MKYSIWEETEDSGDLGLNPPKLGDPGQISFAVNAFICTVTVVIIVPAESCCDCWWDGTRKTLGRSCDTWYQQFATKVVIVLSLLILWGGCTASGTWEGLIKETHVFQGLMVVLVRKKETWFYPNNSGIVVVKWKGLKSTVNNGAGDARKAKSSWRRVRSNKMLSSLKW